MLAVALSKQSKFKWAVNSLRKRLAKRAKDNGVLGELAVGDFCEKEDKVGDNVDGLCVRGCLRFVDTKAGVVLGILGVLRGVLKKQEMFGLLDSEAFECLSGCPLPTAGTTDKTKAKRQGSKW